MLLSAVHGAYFDPMMSQRVADGAKKTVVIMSVLLALTTIASVTLPKKAKKHDA